MRTFKLFLFLLQLEVSISWLGKGLPRVASVQKVPIILLLSHLNQPPSGFMDMESMHPPKNPSVYVAMYAQ